MKNELNTTSISVVGRIIDAIRDEKIRNKTIVSIGMTKYQEEELIKYMSISTKKRLGIHARLHEVYGIPVRRAESLQISIEI